MMGATKFQRGSGGSILGQRMHIVYVLLFALLLVGVFLSAMFELSPFQWFFVANKWPDSFRSLRKDREVIVPASSPLAKPTNTECHYYNCFNVYRCGLLEEHRMAVYIYPVIKFMDKEGIPITNPLSREFYDLLQAILESHYYTDDPTKACLFIPAIDLLNQNNLRLKETAQALASLA